MRRYRRDTGLSVRIALSLVVLLLLFVPLLLWPIGALLFAGIAVGRAFFARRDPAELTESPPELRSLVDRLCALADLQPPQVAVLESAFPNAYTPKGRMLVVTRGLLRELSTDELEAVVAHELAHIANRDAVVMRVVSFPARLARDIAIALSRVYLVPFAFAAWVAAAVATLPVMAFSRYRELVADNGAALLTGRPESLMSALQKLSAGVARIPREDLRAVAGLNPYLIMPTVPAGGLELDPFALFPTHPTVEQRLERLARLQRSDAPIVVEPPLRPENPRAALGLLLAVVTWPLAWAASSLGDASIIWLAAMLTWVAAFVCGVQAIGFAQRGAAGGRLAALSFAVLAAPVIYTVVGAIYLA